MYTFLQSLLLLDIYCCSTIAPRPAGGCSKSFLWRASRSVPLPVSFWNRCSWLLCCHPHSSCAPCEHPSPALCTVSAGVLPEGLRDAISQMALTFRWPFWGPSEISGFAVMSLSCSDTFRNLLAFKENTWYLFRIFFVENSEIKTKECMCPFCVLYQEPSVFSTVIFLSSSSTEHWTTTCAFAHAVACPFPSFLFTEPSVFF